MKVNSDRIRLASVGFKKGTKTTAIAALRKHVRGKKLVRLDPPAGMECTYQGTIRIICVFDPMAHSDECMLYRADVGYLA